MSEKETLEKCYCMLYRGMIEKDESILREVLHPSFVLVHMTGIHQRKEEFIKAVKNGTLNYNSATHQKIDIVSYENRAELIGQSVVHAAVFGGGWHTWRLQLRCILVRENDKWLISEAQASAY